MAEARTDYEQQLLDAAEKRPWSYELRVLLGRELALHGIRTSPYDNIGALADCLRSVTDPVQPNPPTSEEPD